MIPQEAKKYVYYEEKDIILLHGDCLEILPLFEPDSIDLILTDPPYGKSIHSDFDGKFCETNKFKPQAWDINPMTQEQAIHIRRIGSNQIIWGGNFFELPISNCWFCWVKNIPDGFNKSKFELAWTSYNKVNQLFDFTWNGAIRKGSEKLSGHPTQKPVELMKWCLSFALDANTILDPFLGSGTTAIAAKNLGRKCIGIEIEEKYLKIAKERLKQEVLF